LLIKFVNDEFMPDHVPTVFDNHAKFITHNDQLINMYVPELRRCTMHDLRLPTGAVRSLPVLLSLRHTLAGLFGILLARKTTLVCGLCRTHTRMCSSSATP